jgi:hypothetical protein
MLSASAPASALRPVERSIELFDPKNVSSPQEGAARVNGAFIVGNSESAYFCEAFAADELPHGDCYGGEFSRKPPQESTKPGHTNRDAQLGAISGARELPSRSRSTDSWDEISAVHACLTTGPQ